MATEVVHTVGSGGDYADLAAWSAAQARNLVSANEIAVAEIVGTLTEPSYVPISTSAGWSTDSTRRIVIRAAAPFNGTLGAGSKLVLGSSSPYGMAFSAALHVSIENLEVEYTGTSRAVNGSVLRISGCFIYGSSITDPNVLLLCDSAELNSSVFQSSARGYDARNVTATVDNCGFFALSGLSTYGLLTDAGTTVRNTVSAGWRDADIYGTPGTDSNNATLDGSVGATISTATGVDFVDYGSGDYTPTATGALFKAGTNPLTTASDADDWKDITGKTRAYWDIGAFAAPASLAENTHLATFTTRPTDTGSSGGPNVAGTETNYPGYIDLSEAPQALWDAVTSGGGDIRVFENQAGGLVELPAEVVSCDPTYQSFDGSNDYMLATGVSVTDADDFVVRMEARSTNTDIENFIFCFTSATAIIGVVSGGSGNGDKLRIQVRNDAGTDVFNVNDATESSASFFDGDWHEIVFTKSGDVFSVDVDGTEVINLENTNPGSITTNQLVIGGLYRTSLILACPVDIARLEVTGVFASTYDARNISGTTWTDSVGSNDGTLNGTPAAPVAASGELHYLLPSISASTPQEIRLYADGVSSRYDHADPFGRNAVWGDYEAVVHGGSATDSTGNHTVTANNSPTVTSGKVGDSYNFNGSNQSLNLGDITALDAASELSVSAWVKPDTLVANNTILARWGSSLQFLFGSPSNGANLQFAVDTPTSVFSSTGVFTAGSWTHAVGTWIGGGAVALYADGASLATAGNNNTLTLRSVASDVGIAYRAETSNYYYDGDVEEARIRISALSPQWITTEYNNQSDPSSFYTVTDPNAGGSESISPDSLYQSVSIEGVTLTQAHVLAAANLAQLQAIGAATLAQANSIAPHGVDQTAGIESATLTQAHIIAPAGISQHQQIGTASLVSAGVLSVFGLAQTQTLDEAILTVAGALDVDGVSQSQVLEALTLVQNNILAPAGLAQEAALEATTINAAALGITPAGIEQVMAIDPTGLTQYHVLAVSDLAQDQILEAARFGGLVIGELQGRIYVFAALDGDVYAIPALTGTIH
jgi:hypothetical protein